jgi:hypothetical protein
VLLRLSFISFSWHAALYCILLITLLEALFYSWKFLSLCLLSMSMIFSLQYCRCCLHPPMLGNLGWTCRFWNYWICSQRMGLLDANCQLTKLGFWSIGEVPLEAQLLRVFKPFSKCKFWFGMRSVYQFAEVYFW